MMSYPSHDSLFREIDEDIRRERYAKLWKQYGSYLIATLVLLLAGIAGYSIWQERSTAQRALAATQFSAAMRLANKDQPAAEAQLSALASDGPSGYAMLAALQRATLLAKADGQAARTAYQDVQRSTSDPMYRDLAVLLEAMVVLQRDTLPIDVDAIQAKLQPLALDTNPWRFSARELMALLAWKSGHTAEAKTQLGALVTDPQTPAAIRERAQQMMAQIG
jgi:hypothetical protein